MVAALAATTTGSLLVNNQPKSHPLNRYFNRFVGYVEQIDSHVESATVREGSLISFLFIVVGVIELGYDYCLLIAGFADH